MPVMTKRLRRGTRPAGVTLGCGVITGAGAVLRSYGLRAGQDFAVFGAGGVGLSAVMAARIAGARRIVAVEPLAWRRELALELGATHAQIMTVLELVSVLGIHSVALGAPLLIEEVEKFATEGPTPGTF